MVLDKLSSSLRSTLNKVTKGVFVDESLINELVKDLQRSLLQADVNVNLVLNLTKEIKRRALEEKEPRGVSKKEFLVKIVYEELVKFLGGEKKPLNINKTKIMFTGLYGSGKTTTIGKIGRHYSVRGKKVAALGLDTFRPGAMDQLEQLAKQANIKYFIDKEEKDPVKIYKKHEKELETFDLVLIDTSGRDALNQELIQEIETLHKEIQPQETFLVINADIGQTAEKQAQQFHESCGITGVIVTKMDGTARAGGALSACATTKAPIVFIGVGEKIQDLEQFNPEGFVGRLLGMGDLESLLEKVRESIDEEKAQDIGNRFLKGDFNFLDLYEQLQAMNKMGSLSKIMEMLPGLGSSKIPKEMLDVQEDKLKKWKFCLQSMTKQELENPELLGRPRIERIASGSGTNTRDVRDLLKQYRQTKKMMKMVSGRSDKAMEKLMKKFSQGNVKI
tara:strand:- start:2706 stop:4049 length:1344 start_codon:yes stop_codon:yes gene_type:complete